MGPDCHSPLATCPLPSATLSIQARGPFSPFLFDPAGVTPLAPSTTSKQAYTFPLPSFLASTHYLLHSLLHHIDFLSIIAMPRL
jgi:hypothetical protein